MQEQIDRTNPMNAIKKVTLSLIGVHGENISAKTAIIELKNLSKKPPFSRLNFTTERGATQAKSPSQ